MKYLSPLSILTVIFFSLCLLSPISALMTKEGYEQYIKSCTAAFEAGKKPRQDSKFVAQWGEIKDGKGISLKLYLNGKMTLNWHGKIQRGVCVEYNSSTPEKPIGIYKIRKRGKEENHRFATISITDDLLTISYGDHIIGGFKKQKDVKAKD